MATLSSKLFTEGDPAVVKKLEDCANGRPSEIQSHFREGSPGGEHIRRLQEALKKAAAADPDLKLPPFTENGVYDKAFADAIEVYKDKRDIRNFANKIDRIVGKKTIQELDKEATRRKQVNPDPRPVKPNEVPRQIPNCGKDSEIPTSQNFEITMLMGVSGGEVVEVLKMFFAIRDTTNGFSALYRMTAGGVGLGASPISPAVAGGPKPFNTDKPVQVTRFGPAALIRGITSPPPIILSFTQLSLSFRAPGSRGLPQTPFFTIDTGPISIPGVGVHGGVFSILTRCGSEAGATRKKLDITDVGPVE